MPSGFIIAIGDILLFGFIPVFAHYYVAKLDPLLFSAAITLVGSLPFLFYLGVTKQLNELYRPKMRMSFFLISLFAALGTAFLFVGTKMTSGINTGLLLQTESLYSLLLSSIFLNEIITKNHLMSALVMILGAGIIVIKKSFHFNPGDILILSVPLIFQFGHLVAKKLLKSNNNPNIIVAARLFYSGIMLIIAALLINPSAIKELFILNNLYVVVIFALIFRSLDMFLWYQALKRVNLSVISAMIPLNVSSALIGSVVFLKEIPTFQQYLGALCIIGGLVWLSLIQLKTHKS